MENAMDWEKLEWWWGMCELSSFRVRVQDHGSLAPSTMLIGAYGASPEAVIAGQAAACRKKKGQIIRRTS